MKVLMLSFLFLVTILSCTSKKTQTSKTLVGTQITEIQILLRESDNKNLETEERLGLVKRALLLATETEVDSLIIKSLAKESTLYGVLRNYDAAILSARELLDKSTLYNDKEFEARAFGKLGRYYFKKGDRLNAYRYYVQASKKFDMLDMKPHRVKMRRLIGEIEKDIGDFKSAESSIVDGLQLESPKNYSSRSALFQLLSITQREQEKFENADKYIDSALSQNSKMTKSNLKKSRRKIYLNSKALILRDIGSYKKADSIFSVLLKGTPLNKDSIWFARVLSNQAYNKWKQGDRENDSIEKKLLHSLKIREKLKDSLGLIASYNQLAQYYKEYKTGEALKNAYKYLEVSENMGAIEEQIEALGLLLDMEDDTDIKEDLLDEKEIRQDSLNKLTAETIERFAEIKYSKESEIRSHNRINEIITNENDSLKLRNQLFISLLVLSVFLLILLVYWFKQRQKLVALRSKYETEIAISKKVHDELANDIFGLKSELEMKDVPSETLQRVDVIYERTRDISKDYSPVNTEAHFSETLTYMLSSFFSGNARLVLKGINDIEWVTISEQKKMILYRSLQELMVNMKKHSKASVVVIAFAKAKKELSIHYSDNGIGVSSKTTLGNGLYNVESRITDVKGRFTFESNKETGCKAIIVIPA